MDGWKRFDASVEDGKRDPPLICCAEQLPLRFYKVSTLRLCVWVCECVCVYVCVYVCVCKIMKYR